MTERGESFCPRFCFVTFAGMLTVYTAWGEKRYETPVNKDSKRVFKLMGDDYVTLNFSVADPVYFKLGDYTDIPGFGRFELVEPYQPSYNRRTNGYDYKLKLEAQHMKWRNKIMRYMPLTGGNECSWSLTASALTHLGQVIDNANALGKECVGFLYNGVTEWSMAVDDSLGVSVKTISYSSTSILDAVADIAKAFKCDWWTEGNIVRLGRCELNNDRITLEIDRNVSDMSRSDSREQYVTRIIPFGSKRNLSPRYRKDLVFDVKEVRDGGNMIYDSARPVDAGCFPAEMVSASSEGEGKSVTGITVDVIEADGTVSASYPGCVMNPGFSEDYSERGWLRLPSGVKMDKGQRYAMRQIVLSWVKSSYFSQRLSAYDGMDDVLRTGITEQRLMLPESYGKSHVDVSEGLSMSEGVEAVVTFDDIYPHAECTVTAVEEVRRKETTENNEGTVSEGGFTAFVLTDDFFTASRPFKQEYIIGDSLEITFLDGLRYKEGDTIPEGKKIGDLVNPESGKLNGWTFKAFFSSADDGSARWEVVRDETSLVPNDILKPEKGDRFVIIGIDTSVIDDYYTEKAEEELLEQAVKLAGKINTDTSTYECTLFSDFARAGEPFTPGTRVNLINPAYTPVLTDGDGNRQGRHTRVIGLELNLDIPYDSPKYTVGETANYSRYAELEQSLDDLRLSQSSSGGQGATSVYVISRHDTTPPSDANVYSALRSGQEFLSKTKSDRTPYTLAAGGLQTGRFQRGLTGSDVDAGGNAEYESVIIRSFMKVWELIYNRLNALEGEYSFSDSGTIEQVTPNEDGTLTALMRRRWDGDFTDFQPGDVIYGYVNDLSNSAVKTWGKAWARVTEVDRTENTLTLVAYDDEDTPAGKNLAVTKGMTVTRWGNAIAPSEQTHALYPAFIVKRERNGEVSYVNTRQWCMVISAEQGNIRMMDGIVKPIVDPSDNITATVLGRLPKGLLDEETEALVNPDQPYLYARGIIVQDLIRIGYKGVSIRTPNFRGEWKAETAASDTDYYRMTGDMADCVAHKGALWQCAVGHTSASEPSDGNPDWIRLTALPSEDWRIIPSTNVVYIRTDSYSTDTLEVTVRHYGDGVTDYTTPEELDATGARLMFSLDGVKYNEYWVRQGETLADLELGDNTEGSGDTLTLGGNNVPWLEITDNIHLQLQDAQTSEVLTSYTVAVVKDGRNGADGQSVRGDFTSIVFRRSDTELSTADTPTGGTYSNPLPDGGMWTDGIPSGSERIWASSRIFKGDGTPTPWSRPRLMADTQDYDVEFSDIENPQPPQGHPNTNAQWHDPSDKSSSIDWEGMIWRAESWKRDGKWSDWTVMRIKGEKGDPGSDGTDGSSTEVRYRIVSGYPESVGIDNPHDREPQGWDTTHRLCASGESLWRTEAAILQGDTLSPAGWSVPVMVTGRPGKDGVGLDGKAGPIVYPGGVYDRDTLYISTADRCPYVMDGRQNGMGVYYRLLPEKTYCGAEQTADRDTPAKDYALSDSQTVWQRMDGFSAIYAEILMARFARLGDAVFYDNWMFSAMGTDSQGNESSEYGDFGNASSSFIPNLQIDLLNGDIIARRGDFYGYVRQRPTVITPQNVERYLKKPRAQGESYLIDWCKTGPSVRLEGTWNLQSVTETVYLIMPNTMEATEAELETIRTYAGMTATIYNRSNVALLTSFARLHQKQEITGTVGLGYYGASTSTPVPSGYCMGMRCVLTQEYLKSLSGEYSDPQECVAWEVTGLAPIWKPITS